MDPFKKVVIPNAKMPGWVYEATKNGDEVTVRSKPLNPIPGVLGQAGKIDKMTTEEFTNLMAENLPKVDLQRTPPSDTVQFSAKD